jgi:hypothetical protein
MRAWVGERELECGERGEGGVRTDLSVYMVRSADAVLVYISLSNEPGFHSTILSDLKSEQAFISVKQKLYYHIPFPNHILSWIASPSQVLYSSTPPQLYPVAAKHYQKKFASCIPGR